MAQLCKLTSGRFRDSHQVDALDQQTGYHGEQNGLIGWFWVRLLAPADRRAGGGATRVAHDACPRGRVGGLGGEGVSTRCQSAHKWDRRKTSSFKLEKLGRELQQCVVR